MTQLTISNFSKVYVVLTFNKISNIKQGILNIEYYIAQTRIIIAALQDFDIRYSTSIFDIFFLTLKKVKPYTIEYNTNAILSF